MDNLDTLIVRRNKAGRARAHYKRVLNQLWGPPGHSESMRDLAIILIEERERATQRIHSLEATMMEMKKSNGMEI